MKSTRNNFVVKFYTMNVTISSYVTISSANNGTILNGKRVYAIPFLLHLYRGNDFFTGVEKEEFSEARPR